MTLSRFALSALVSILLCRASLAQEVPEITFVQLTDAHLFDEGWNEPMPDAFRHAASNWEALHWSVDRINALVAEGRRIDFVVYTGDLGLQNVSFARSTGCLAQPVHIETGLPPVPAPLAAHDLLAELDRLTVRRVYFVSGNNDPVDEEVSDGRYSCFLSALREQIHTRISTLSVQSLDADRPLYLGGFTLLGLNSSSFKRAGNYERDCSRTYLDDQVQRLQQTSCPTPEMTLLEQQVATGKPILLFTHVPDLRNPYRKSAAWDVSPEVRTVWERQVAHSNLLAIFAGHLHSSDRALYGSTATIRTLSLSRVVGEKTYVAPPLVIKNQVDQPEPARGFLLVTAKPAGVASSHVFWFEDTLLTGRR